MPDKASVDINFLYATATVVVSIIGCIFALKQNRKQNEEAIDRKVKKAVSDMDEKTKLKIENEGLKRDKLKGDFDNIVTDSLIDKKALRDVSKDVSELKKRDVLHEGNITAIKEDIKDIKHSAETNTNKLFDKLDQLSVKQNSDSMMIVKCISDLEVKIANK